MPKPKVIVEQDDANPVPAMVLAESIIQISNAARRLSAGRLNQKAILVLLSHETGLPQKTVRTVLEGMADLERTYLK